MLSEYAVVKRRGVIMGSLARIAVLLPSPAFVAEPGDTQIRAAGLDSGSIASRSCELLLWAAAGIVERVFLVGIRPLLLLPALAANGVPDVLGERVDGIL